MGAFSNGLQLVKTLSPKWGIAIEGLDDDQQRTIMDRMRSISYDPHNMLFEQGEPSDSLILISDGRVRLYQSFENGEEFTYGICVGGALLGLAALVRNQPRILAAEAMDKVNALSMTRADFLNCIREVPQFHWNITRLLAILSIDSIERSGPMVLDCAAVRLGTTLQSLGRPDEKDPTRQRHHVVGHTQEDLAKMVGVSRTWIAIALSQFERHGLISKTRGRITIQSATRLDQFIAAERSH
jgi:CRP/FNR family transcriptional regulator, cyclic AMP receptor protein